MDAIKFISDDKIRQKNIDNILNDFKLIKNNFIDKDFLRSQIKDVEINPITNLLFKINDLISTTLNKTYQDIINKENISENNINNFITILNTTKDKLDNLNNQINNSKALLNILNNTTLTIENTRKLIMASTSLIPSPPGVPGGLINILDILKNTLDSNLKPKIKELIGIFNNLILLLKYILKKFKKLINNSIIEINNVISSGLTNIDINTLQQVQTSLDSNLNQLLISDESYKDFILKINSVNFNNKVKQQQAIAFNQFNIPIFKTKLSFTTNKRLLFDELKIIIDNNII